MIPVSDLRKGNLIRTEYGICPVVHIVFSDIYVLGKDNRVVHAKKIEGVGIGEIDIFKIGETIIAVVLRKWLFVHELQNHYYWNTKTELKIY